MQVYHDLSAFPELSFPVVTTGTFDGVHLGHQTIIKRIQEQAQKYNGQTVVITFHPHPRLVLEPHCDIDLLNTLEERIEHLRRMGVEHLMVIEFTRQFAGISSSDFIENILVESIGTKRLVIGYDHHFGRNREGSFRHLKENAAAYGFEVEEIPAQDIDNIAISSTRIRAALKSGDVETANRYLGYNYSCKGTVVEGNKLGRTIGFPTANLDIIGERKLIPARGVYAVMVKVGDEPEGRPGMMNIGLRPTVSDSGNITAEVHLLDFEGDMYGATLSVEFVKSLRAERKFNSLEELKTQLAKDREETRSIFRYLG